MVRPREKDPFIQKGDDVIVNRPNHLAGTWRVLAARYASATITDPRVEVVLRRGGASMTFKTIFDEKSMRVKSNRPDYMLGRDIRVQKPIRFRPPENPS